MKNTAYKIIITLFLTLCLFSKTEAAVIFSEIAWMGGPNSSADEWIELYNSGAESVSLDGYTIVSESKKLNITLSGTIPANSYYLIERTDDSSVPTVTADLVVTFGTGLANGGDNLYLKDKNGQSVDSLLFASGWPAGDNTTKQTMQKLSGVWSTMDPSPKTAPINGQTTSGSNTSNTSQNQDSNTTNSQSNNTANTSGGSGTPSPKVSMARFNVSILNDQLAQVPLSIVIDNRDESGGTYIYGQYKINFGDGVAKTYKINEPVLHTYEYPGYYKLTVKFFNSEWSLLPVKQTSIDVRIDKPDIVIDRSRAPIIILKNKTDKDIDASNFILQSGEKSFSLPEESIIFAGKELWLGPKVTGFSKEESLASAVLAKEGSYIDEPLLVKTQTQLVKSKTTNNFNIGSNLVLSSPYLQNQKNESLNNFDEQGDTTNTALVSESNFAKQKPHIWLWFLFAIVVVIASVLFIRIQKNEEADANDFTLLDE